jgi:hypothetical protein
MALVREAERRQLMCPVLVCGGWVDTQQLWAGSLRDLVDPILPPPGCKDAVALGQRQRRQLARNVDRRANHDVPAPPPATTHQSMHACRPPPGQTRRHPLRQKRPASSQARLCRPASRCTTQSAAARFEELRPPVRGIREQAWAAVTLRRRRRRSAAVCRPVEGTGACHPGPGLLQRQRQRQPWSRRRRRSHPATRRRVLRASWRERRRRRRRLVVAGRERRVVWIFVARRQRQQPWPRQPRQRSVCVAGGGGGGGDGARGGTIATNRCHRRASSPSLRTQIQPHLSEIDYHLRGREPLLVRHGAARARGLRRRRRRRLLPSRLSQRQPACLRAPKRPPLLLWPQHGCVCGHLPVFRRPLRPPRHRAVAGPRRRGRCGSRCLRRDRNTAAGTPSVRGTGRQLQLLRHTRILRLLQLRRPCPTACVIRLRLANSPSLPASSPLPSSLSLSLSSAECNNQPAKRTTLPCSLQRVYLFPDAPMAVPASACTQQLLPNLLHLPVTGTGCAAAPRHTTAPMNPPRNVHLPAAQAGCQRALAPTTRATAIEVIVNLGEGTRTSWGSAVSAAVAAVAAAAAAWWRV